MAICRCKKGHFYDNAKFFQCPICLSEQKEDGLPGSWQEDQTLDFSDGDDTVAIDLLQEDRKANPVVGWLVCVRGEERGRDWRLSSGRNNLGTIYPADVLLGSQCSVLDSRLCSVVYDDKHKEFLLVPGRGTLVFLNNCLLVEPTHLQDGDEISVGEYVLCFQSFRGISKGYW